MGRVSPISRIAEKHGIELITNMDLGGTIAKINGHEFSGATPKDALDAAMTSLRDAGEASLAPPSQGETIVPGGEESVTSVPPKDKPKRKRSSKKKKSAAPKLKKRARAAEDEEAEAEEGEEGEGTEYVKRKYRQRYAQTDNHCGDPMAEAFYEAVRVEGEVQFNKVKEVADANGVSLARWRGRNLGMIRMNLGNVLRGKLRRGETVTIGKQTFKPEKSNGKAA